MRKHIETIHERGYWLSTRETDKHVFDKRLMAGLILMFKDVDNIIDIGCGNGSYTKAFIEQGFDCIGYDGSPLTEEISNGLCHIKDFSNLVDIGKFELVLCLEVGEHIPKEYEQIFLDNVANASKKHICLSWALLHPRQWGTGHYNCQDNDYIINEMDKRGFRYDPVATGLIREIAKLSYLKKTIMIFKKK
jgi:cyclopropane fatty-acyl-phospholipid synthase-like methyltransferase